MLERYFTGKTPADFERLEDLEAGATYQIIKGNHKEAYLWVDRIL
ncbi:hypothetical protein [Paraglaciecola marina]|nr:hypothetical protein [Paraglaciecola marina]